MELPTSVSKLQGMVRRYQATSRNARAKTGEVMQSAIAAGVSGATGFGLGFMSRKAPAAFATTFGAGVPFPLALAIAAHGAALLGVGRNMEEHVRTVANAAVTSHLFLLGQDTASGAAGAGAGTGSLASRAASVVSGAGITQADLMRAAR